MSDLFAQSLRFERRSIGGWIAVMALMLLATVGSWPSIRGEAEEFSRVFEQMPAFITALLGEAGASFQVESIVGSRLFGTVGLIIFIGWAVSRGASAIAGAEQDGTLELWLAAPVSRQRLLLERLASMVVGLGFLVSVQLLLLLMSNVVVDLGLGVQPIVEASVGLYVLSLLFGALALALGAWTGRRSFAVGVSAGLAGVLVVLTSLSRIVDQLEPAGDLSPFTYFDGSVVLERGVDLSPMLIMLAIAVALVAVGLWSFERRDLT